VLSRIYEGRLPDDRIEEPSILDHYAFCECERLLYMTPRYRKILSSLVWPSKIYTARQLPVCL